jgi:hypothetical protein
MFPQFCRIVGDYLQISGFFDICLHFPLYRITFPKVNTAVLLFIFTLVRYSIDTTVPIGAVCRCSMDERFTAHGQERIKMEIFLFAQPSPVEPVRQPTGPHFDYVNQAWTVNGRYVVCEHPGKCNCYGTLHAGELAPIENLPTAAD